MSFDDSPYDEVQEAVALLVDLVGRPERGASTPSRLRRRGALTGPAPPPPIPESQPDSIPAETDASTVANTPEAPVVRMPELSPEPAPPAAFVDHDEGSPKASANVEAKVESQPEATPELASKSEPEAETETVTEQANAAMPTEPGAPPSAEATTADATNADTAPMASWNSEAEIPEPTKSDPRTAEVLVTSLDEEPSTAKPEPDTEPIVTDTLFETDAPRTETVVLNVAGEFDDEHATDKHETGELDSVRLDAVTRELPKPEATPAIEDPPAVHAPIALPIEDDDDEDDWHETDLDETAAGWTGAATQAPREANDATPKTPDDLPPETTKNYFQSRIGARRKDNPSS